MRVTTVLLDGRPNLAVVREDTVFLVDRKATGLAGIRALAAGGSAALARLQAWLDAQPADAGTPLETVTLGPAVPDPGAIYTIGHNYRAPTGPSDGTGDGAEPREPGEPREPSDRPLIYGKASSSVAGHGATLRWDRSLTDNVDAEVELGVVIGVAARAVAPEQALDHVFGFTIINDVSSRDPWLDGDQWLIGKSMPGFCPVGPWIVTADEMGPTDDLRLGCVIDGAAIQDGTTRDMRFAIPAVIAYLSRHLTLRPGDLIATGTPARLLTPPGPDRRLRAGDRVTAWVGGIGELTTTIAERNGSQEDKP